MIVGGKLYRTSEGGCKKVSKYDIESDSYLPMKDLPGHRMLHRLALKNDYIYLFGGVGYRESSGMVDKVFRITTSLNATTDWEELNKMKEKLQGMIVVPYN